MCPESLFASSSGMPRITVLGLGGGGGNAVNRMLEFGLRGVHFAVANTDAQVLALSPAPHKIQLGPQLTRGLGAGGNPTIGRKAAEESAEALRRCLEGSDLVFLTAGLGGGTGTGAIPVAARIARELGAVVVAVVTLPFAFEQGKRQRNAQEGLHALLPHAHTVITIPNQRLLEALPHVPLETAFRAADDVLRQAVQGVTDLITTPGVVNLDFSHLRRLLLHGGGAVFAVGHGKGEHRLQDALHQALHHPLLDDIDLRRATGLLVNFTAGPDLSLLDISQALHALQVQLPEEHTLLWGFSQQEDFEGRVQVTLIVAGVGPGAAPAEQADASVARPQPQSEAVASSPQEAPARPRPEPAIPPAQAQNLNLPAFLRHRSRYSTA